MERTSAEAMSKCSRIWRNDGRFLGLLFLEGREFGGEKEFEGRMEQPSPRCGLENRILERVDPRPGPSVPGPLALLSPSTSKSRRKVTCSSLFSKRPFLSNSVQRNTLWDTVNQGVEIFNLPSESGFQTRLQSPLPVC